MSHETVKVFNHKTSNIKNTIQTEGMLRKQIFADEKSWVGFVETEPVSVSAWHHHGEYNTIVCIISGTIVIEFDEKNLKSIEGKPGEVIVVPKGLVHREKNPNKEKGIVTVIRIGEGIPVFNVEK